METKVKKYKCLSYDYTSFENGEIYSENVKGHNGHETVAYYAELNPEDWQLIEEEPELKRGDMVWVSDDNPDAKTKQRPYLTYIDGANYPNVVVGESSIDDFNNNKPFSILVYKYATKVTEPIETTMTIAEVEKLLQDKGIIKGSLKITK